MENNKKSRKRSVLLTRRANRYLRMRLLPIVQVDMSFKVATYRRRVDSIYVIHIFMRKILLTPSTPH